MSSFKQKIINKIRRKIFNNKLNIKKNEWFFILPYGIGDIFMVLLLIDQFRKQHVDDLVSLGIVKPNHKEVIQLFNINLYRIEIISNHELLLCGRNKLMSGIPIILHPSHFLSNSLYSLIGYNNITLIDIYKILLNIPIQSQINFDLKINGLLEQKAKKRFESFEFETKNTIIIAPHAVSVNEKLISHKFWLIIIAYFVDKGYKVGILSSDSVYLLNENIKLIKFPLNETIYFLNLAYAFIGIRSGLCDLASRSTCHKIIIYPKQQWYCGSLLEGASLEKMGLAIEKIYEVEIESNNDAKIITNILR